eukprot:85583-Chlamydomonas_euryale.AAC.1
MAELESMGFPHNRAVRALHFSGNRCVKGKRGRRGVRALHFVEMHARMCVCAGDKPGGKSQAQRRGGEVVRADE